MTNNRVENFLDELLGEYEQTPSLLEQKEELLTHLTERVQDHMERGLSYDEAFNKTIKDLGDVNALVAGMASIKTKSPNKAKNSYNRAWGSTFGIGALGIGDMPYSPRGRRSGQYYRYVTILTILAVSAYIFVGMAVSGTFWAWGWTIIPLVSLLYIPDLQTRIVSSTPFIFFLLGFFLGWWIWAWMIIPLSALSYIPDRRIRLVSASPFIYILLGIFFGWWAWAWAIIPLSSIVLLAGVGD